MTGTHEQVNALNEILKGEHLAIDVYEVYLNRLDDPIIKGQLRDIQREHESHALKLADRIRELGGRPKEGRGMAGAMATAMRRAQSMIVADKVDILRSLYDGEKERVASVERTAGENLGRNNSEMVREIIVQDQGHLDSLKAMEKKYLN